MATIIHVVFTVLILGLPAYLVLRAKRLGVLWGTLIGWFIGYEAGMVERWYANDFDETFGLGLWMLFGWAISLVYCICVFGAKHLVLAFTHSRPR